MTKNLDGMSQSHLSTPAGPPPGGGGGISSGPDATPASAAAATKRKSRKRQRTPPHPLITTSSGSGTAQSQGHHHLALMPPSFMPTSTAPNEHPFALTDPSLLSPTAAYPPVTDPLSSSLPAMLSDSLRLTNPAAAAAGGGGSPPLPQSSASPVASQGEGQSGAAMIHAQNPFAQQQQQQQHFIQPSASSSSSSTRPRFVTRRHSDVVPISYQVSWTPNDGNSALLEAPAHAAGEGTCAAPTSPTDSHFSQATTMQYSPTASTFDSLSFQASASQAQGSQAEQPHPHVSPSSYSPHPHVLPTIPTIGGSSFHPHSIAPPPPPPHFAPTAAYHSSPNPTAKKKMRSEPPPALLPVTSSAAAATPPLSAGLGLFNSMSLAPPVDAAGIGGGSSAHMFDSMLGMSQPASPFDATSASGDLQYAHQHHYLFGNDAHPMHNDMFPPPDHAAHSALNGGGAHPFMFHTSAAAAAPAPLVPDTHYLDPMASGSGSGSGAAHPSPFRPGSLLDPTHNTASGSTFLFDVSLMNPSPMASPYMVRGSRPGSAATSASSDSRPTSAHSGLVIHAAGAAATATPPQVHGAGSGAAEMARRALAGGAYARGPPHGALDAYELARALGGPIHMRDAHVPGTAQSAGEARNGNGNGNGNGASHAMVGDTHQQATLGLSAPHVAPGTYSGGSAGQQANNYNGGGGSLSPMSVTSSSAAGSGSASAGAGAGSQPLASTSPTDAASLFFTDTASPGAMGGTAAAAAAHHFAAEFGAVVGADHLDPLISATHADDVNGFEQLVQALLMSHPDLLPSGEVAGGAGGMGGVGHASFLMSGAAGAMQVAPQVAPQESVFGTAGASGSVNAVHESAEMDVDVRVDQEAVKPERRGVSTSQEMDQNAKVKLGAGRPRMEMPWPVEDMMDVIMEDCEHPQKGQHWNDADDASALSDMLQAAGVETGRSSRRQQPLERAPPTPTRQHQLSSLTGWSLQAQHGPAREPDRPGQRDPRHDAHTAAAALMLVELHNRAAPEHRRMSTIDVPPPSPPSIVRVQVADGSQLASSPSVLPLNLPMPALYAPQQHQQHQQHQQLIQQAHPQRQHPVPIQLPDTHTPTTRTLTDRQLQTIVESMLYATSLQGSCHSQGCWHMYARAYLSTHGELPRDAAKEPAKWAGRWGLCKVSLYTPRVAQKSYGSEKRFLCPPPMISVVGAPLFPESPLGQPMGLPPAHATDKVPRWITLLPEAYQPHVIMLMRGEIEGAELPEDVSMEAGGGGGGALGAVADVNETVVSTQRGERVMLSEAGWRAAASSLPAAVLAKMVSAIDRVKERQTSAANRQKQQQQQATARAAAAATAAASAAAVVKVESSDVEMVDEHPEEEDGNDQEPQSNVDEDEGDMATASSTRRTRNLRSSVRSSVRTRSQVRSTSARGAAGSTPSPRKAAAAVAPMVRARRASIAAVARDSSSSSAGESDSDASDGDGAGEDSDFGTTHVPPSGKSKLRTARTAQIGNNKGMVAVEKYCTEALCAEVPAERWVFRNVWISDSERRKEFSCVFQLAEPASSPSAASSSAMVGADKGKKQAGGRQEPKKLLEFASKPVRVISKPSKKKIEVRSSGASPSAGIIYAGSLIALFNRIRSQTVSTKYLSIGSSVPVPSEALSREILSCAEVNKPQKTQGDVDLDQDRFLANLDVIKHVFPGAIKSEQLKYLCSTASWAALRLEVIDEFERDSPYLNLPQFNCQCEVCATAAEYREALLSTSPGASGASTPELSRLGTGAGAPTSSSDGAGSSRSSTIRMPPATQCLTRGKIVSFNQTVVLVDPVTGLRSREFILRRVDNNTTVILAEGHLLTASGTAAYSAAVSAQPQVTLSGRATSSSSASPSTRSSSRQHMGSGQFPPLRPLHTHPWVLHTYRQASPCASHDPHAASAASHALSIIQASGSRTGVPDAQTLARAFEAPKLDPIAQLHKVAFQLKDSAEYTGAFLTVVGNDIGLYIPQSNHMSFIQSDESKRPAVGARARRNSCPAQPSQLSEAGSTKDIRAGTLTVDVTEGSVWTIVNADKAERSFYIPHPQLLEVDGPLGVDVSHQGFGLGGFCNDAQVDNEKILSTSAPARKCISSLSALSPFPTIASHTIATAPRSYMSDGASNPASVHGMSTTIVLDGNHFLDHPFSIYLADMKCNVDWESNTHATVTFPSPVTILRHLFVGPGSARPGSVPRDASLSAKYSAFIVTPDALHAKIIEERVDTMSSGADAQLMTASQHPGGVVKAPIPARLLSERIIGLSLGSNPLVPSLRVPAPVVPAIASAPMPPDSQSTHSLSQAAAAVADSALPLSTTKVVISSAHKTLDPGPPTASVDSPLQPQLHSTISIDTHQHQSSPLRCIESTADMPPPSHPAVPPTSVLAIPPPAGTTYPLALTTVAAPSSIFGGAHQPFPPHIHHMIQRGMLNGIPSAFPNMSAVPFNILDARFVASAPPAAFVDAFSTSRYLRASMPISPDAKSSTQTRPTVFTSPLSYAPINHSAMTAPPPPTAPPSTKSPVPPATPGRVHSLSGKTIASQRTPTLPKAGRSSPDSSSLSSASSTPPFTKPLARSATLPPSGLKSAASSATPAASSSGSTGGSRRGQGGQGANKKQSAAVSEPPAVVPLPVGVVTVEMVKSPSLLLPLYFVRADGVVYETGRSFLFRLDETVLGSGNVVVLE